MSMCGNRQSFLRKQGCGLMWEESARASRQIELSRHYGKQVRLPEWWHCQEILKHLADCRLGRCFPSAFNIHERMDRCWPGLNCRTKRFLPRGITNASSNGMGFAITIFSTLARSNRRAAARV